MLNKLQEAYETAILESSSTLTSVENGLRQLTWFLPGRFEDAEIASEGREYDLVPFVLYFKLLTMTPAIKVYSALSVLSIYHDSLIAKRLTQIPSLPPSPFPRVQTYTSPTSSGTSESIVQPKIDPPAEKWTDQHKIPPPSDHARYTQHYCATSRTYRRASRTLVFIQYMQLLTEMVVKKRKGDKKRWEVLLWLEGIK
jgi:peroxin-16